MSISLGTVELLSATFFGQVIQQNNVNSSSKVGPCVVENLQPRLIELTTAFSGIVFTFFTCVDTVFTRTATTLKDQSGNYVIGSILPNTSPAYAPLLNGETYVGQVTLYGSNYFAYYIPIVDAITSSIIGAYFIATPLASIYIQPLPFVVSTNTAVLKNIINTAKRLTNDINVSQNQGDIITSYFQPVLESFSAINKGNAYTLFTLIGDDFVRTATTMQDLSGNYAIGTVLSHSSPAYSLLLSNQSFTGFVVLYERNYLTSYTPMVDSFTGSVIGAYFYGSPV